MLKKNNNRSDIYKVSLNIENKNDARIIAYNYIDEESTVLDVGCACGDFGELIQREKKCNVFGMEYDAKSIVIASSTHAYKSIYQIDLNSFNEYEYKKYFNYFDAITLIDVLEHLVEPEKVLISLKKLLKKNAYFIVSLPNVAFCDIKVDLLNDNFNYTDTGILDKTHLKFFTYKTISSMLANLGLEIHECKPKVEYFSTKNLKVPGSIKRYIKNDPHSFVYQYIVKAAPSVKSPLMLKQINNDKMDIKWFDISRELNRIRKIKFISSVFPIDSLQYKIAKKIRVFFK